MNLNVRLKFVAGLLAIAVTITALVLAFRTGAPKPATTAPKAESLSHSVAESTASATKPAKPERKPIALPAIPTSIRPILNAPKVPFVQRLAAVERLGTKLKPEEIKGLYAFLEQPDTAADEKVRGGEFVIKNDLLNALRIQEPPAPGLARLLIAIHRDREQDVVMRDYALQQLITLYEQISRMGLADDEKHDASRGEMQAVLWEALAESDSSIAGTALLGIHNLTETVGQFDSAQLNEAAVALVKSAGTGELTRVTALQVCAQRGLKAVLAEVQQLASRSESVPVKISALAALGSLGGQEDVPFLEQVAGGENTRLRPAALAALSRIQGKRTDAPGNAKRGGRA